ncbi:MAG: hypothetical protein LHW49_04710 [Candidatus Cloacimonetes bacterium]|nr:hypothetical protein [Candidatus Cloacimonadota bacterium]
MELSRKTIIAITLLMILSTGLLYAAKAVQDGPSKKLDLTKYHNVGNIWLRVSNYGFFGSGDDITPPWPSLEYPGGSGVDYLYQGALWFGAKKFRKNDVGKQYYWKSWNGLSALTSENNDIITEDSPDWIPGKNYVPVIDTLVTVGFDGDKDLYEFLPAYNPLEFSQDGYAAYNNDDQIATASIRNQRRGVDDDGDGLIDEDPVGYAFPFRKSHELPEAFARFGSDVSSGFLHEISNSSDTIVEHDEIWFPLGFTDLSWSDPTGTFVFSQPHDDDGDGLVDEDGAPVSEQDYISYYYDYSPFGRTGDRDFGSSASNNKHIPLNIRVRQMSYQWSYEFIKNLVYVEFNITNMNPRDTLYDCAMGIYMDSDVGPQSWGREKASDDKSGYVSGKGAEFAFSFDADFDGGQTPGYLGSRVCTPDPEELEFACWYWKVGDGPDDWDPQKYWNLGNKKTANEKYWLLIGKQPNDSKYTPLRIPPQSEGESYTYIQDEAKDTRYLFAFYGHGTGISEPDDPKNWNLAPKKTMKIVIAVFPGDTIEELKESARWAKEVYGEAQTLTTVIIPDTVSHYNPPEPPEIPRSFAKMVDNEVGGVDVEVYWDNNSEFTVDYITVGTEQIGWNNKPGMDSDSTAVNLDMIPDQFRYLPNELAKVNPFTAWRLRHDFQGYSIWQRSGNGRADRWMLVDRWDKIDTEQDLIDYQVNIGHEEYIDFGGDLGIDKGLPNPELVTDNNFNSVDGYNYYNGYMILDENYFPKSIEIGDIVYGWPIYNLKTAAEVKDEIEDFDSVMPPLTEERAQMEALHFKHPAISDEMFLALYEGKHIPLRGHLGQNYVDFTNYEEDEDHRNDRLARRYYHATIKNVRRGIEHYSAVTAWDRGMPSKQLQALESARDANMKVFFPGPSAQANMDNIYVVPNPYRGSSKFDGRRNKDEKGDKSRRIWFVNLPEKCNIQIYTLAGDLVAEFDHNGEHPEDVISVSKAIDSGIAASGIHSWDLLTKNNQILASGVYLFSVKDATTGKVKVGKFAVIR